MVQTGYVIEFIDETKFSADRLYIARNGVP